MFETLGREWLIDEVQELTDHIDDLTPVEYNESVRYLPASVTSNPGPLSYDVNPFAREIVNCADVNNDVRECNILKGVQITYSTILESIALYFMGHIKTSPCMYVTADKELAKERMEANFIPMLTESDMMHIIKSSDTTSTRKTGKTERRISWEGGGYMVPGGAKNADKMRAASILLMLKDEIDAWAVTVGRDGDPDILTDHRCKGYWLQRKIFRGGTPLIKETSKITKAYNKGDKRKYFVKCKHCGHSQYLVWSGKNKDATPENGKPADYGFAWDIVDGTLDLESVRYLCKECGGAHYEHDKERLFSPDFGAEWRPTCKPSQPGIRSYHLPGFYSPIGMCPWYALVVDWLDAWDVENGRVKEHGLLQAFYNNVLARAYEPRGGDKIRPESVYGHRRTAYTMGQVPNTYATKWAGSRILFLTCSVDVQARWLAVCVFGWTNDFRCFVIEYINIDIEDEFDRAENINSTVWGKLRTIIDEKTYTAADGTEYGIWMTLIDASWEQATITKFCSDYASGVYPILGRDRPDKNQTIKEFSQWVSETGVSGYKIVVDHYKDRLATVLRREWYDDSPTPTDQPTYHFNAPVDITPKQLRELTVETKKKKTNPNTGAVSWFWYRPGNARNELWDLLVYGHAAVEIIAWGICIQHFELDYIDWPQFWRYMEDQLDAEIEAKRLDR